MRTPAVSRRQNNFEFKHNTMKTLTITAMAAAFTAMAAPSHAGSHGLSCLADKLVRESNRVQCTANSVSRELSINFRYTGVYSYLMHELNAVRSKASQIQGMAHHIHCPSGVRRLECSIRDLDRMVHRLTDLVGHAAHDHYNPVSSCKIGHVRNLILSMRCPISKMEGIARSMNASFHRPPPCTGPRPGHGYPPAPEYGHGHGHGPSHGHGFVDHRSSRDQLRDRVIEGVVHGIFEGLNRRRH